ncbi:hypothetical protein GCM10023238_26800 [Streptomyces heliomycini]
MDDSGLQMTPEQLDEARDILTGQRADDITQLGALPKTGFRSPPLSLAPTASDRRPGPKRVAGHPRAPHPSQDLLTTVARPHLHRPAGHSVPQGALAPSGEPLALAQPARGPQPVPVPAHRRQRSASMRRRCRDDSQRADTA